MTGFSGLEVDAREGESEKKSLVPFQRLTPQDLLISLIFVFTSSTINTYEPEWRDLTADEQPDRIVAERYLSSPMRDKEPWEDEVAAVAAAGFMQVVGVR